MTLKCIIIEELRNLPFIVFPFRLYMQKSTIYAGLVTSFSSLKYSIIALACQPSYSVKYLCTFQNFNSDAICASEFPTQAQGDLLQVLSNSTSYYVPISMTSTHFFNVSFKVNFCGNHIIHLNYRPPLYASP